jgi:hypothetical protein
MRISNDNTFTIRGAKGDTLIIKATKKMYIVAHFDSVEYSLVVLHTPQDGGYTIPNGKITTNC